VVVRMSAPEPKGAEVIPPAWRPSLLVPARLSAHLCLPARAPSAKTNEFIASICSVLRSSADTCRPNSTKLQSTH
jgi:hypothetical protein